MGHVQPLMFFKFCAEQRQSLLSILVCVLMSVRLVVNADTITHQTDIDNIYINTTSGPLKIRDFCPGVEYFMNHNTTDTAIIHSNMSYCGQYSILHFTRQQGVVYGMCGDFIPYCFSHIKVPRGMLIRAHIRRLAYRCESSPWETQAFIITIDIATSIKCNFHSPEEAIFDSHTNHIAFSHFNTPQVKINIETIKEYGFVIRYISAQSGCVILPYLEYFRGSFDFFVELKAPHGFVIMISFHSTYDHKWRSPCLAVSYTESDTQEKRISRLCSYNSSQPSVLSTSCLHFSFQYSERKNIDQQIVLFSFHTEYDHPPKKHSGFYNCSVSYYSTFRRHLDCNLKTECEDGHDETERCPFSSPDCQGLVVSHNKCFQYIWFNKPTLYEKAEIDCLKMGGRVSSIKTRSEIEDFRHIFKRHSEFRSYIGNILGTYKSADTQAVGIHRDPVPSMYNKFRQWSDCTMVYNIDHFVSINPYRPSRQMNYMFIDITAFNSKWNIDYGTPFVHNAVCERKLHSEESISVQTINVPGMNSILTTFAQTRQILFHCPSGHMTQSLLSCDVNYQCRKTTYSQLCIFLDMSLKNNTLNFPGRNTAYNIDMFKCNDDLTTISYTLICDFRQDCPDNSDESFCEHPSCSFFLCANHECVLHSQRCNGQSDCLDDSDEDNCVENIFSHTEAERKQRLFISLDGAGYFTQQMMKTDDNCPDTHYWCTEDWVYCLPVYTRCNGYSDCTYGEDEQDCDTMTCNGFYTCRHSRACLHGDHLCDGWGQCPQRDDEWFCDMACPENCLCQGLSFLCAQPYSANLIPHLRSVDATDSRMSLNNFSTSAYLVRLHLSRCSLVDIPHTKLLNVQFIDLAHNQLKTVNMNVFTEMWNLKSLIFTNNPLYLMISKTFDVHYSLRRVDLSRTCLQTFSDESSVYLPHVKYVNLSFSAISLIELSAFKHIPQLTELDLRENPISIFPLTLLSDLSHLKTVFSSNFRCCCKNVFSKQSSKFSCLAPIPLLSSCTKLLPTNLYRLFFWLFSTFAIVGSLVCFIAQFVIKKLYRSSFIMLTTHLHYANICMGFHSGIIAIANELFHGKYIYFEKTWTRSTVCKASGFLSISSSQVSVLIIWFLTLDHVIILWFPSTRWKFNQHSISAACITSLLVGVLLSAIPFLPGLSHLGLDGQSGLCRLALFECNDCHPEARWFTVTVLFNCIMCSMVVTGQVFIYRKRPKYQMTLDPTKRPVYYAVHLLIKLGVTSAMCWCSFGLSSVMALCGVAVSDKIHVALVVFMLPINSALIPLLFIWSVVTQFQERAQQVKVLQKLKTQVSLSEKAIM